MCLPSLISSRYHTELLPAQHVGSSAEVSPAWCWGSFAFGDLYDHHRKPVIGLTCASVITYLCVGHIAALAWCFVSVGPPGLPGC